MNIATPPVIGADKVMDVRLIPCSVKHGLILKTWRELPVGDHFILRNDHDPVPLRDQFEAEYPGAFTWDYLERGPEDSASSHEAAGAAAARCQREVIRLLRALRAPPRTHLIREPHLGCGFAAPGKTRATGRAASPRSGPRRLPGGGLAGPAGGNLTRLANDLAHLAERRELAAGAHLDQQVAHRGGLDGTGHHRTLAGIGGELVQKGALGAAPNNVHDLDAVAGEFLQAAKHFAILEREALVGATDQFALGLWHRLFGLAAEALDGLRHVGRVEEAQVVGINDRTERRGFGGHLGQLPVFVFAAARVESTLALLHQPQAHDVLQQAVSAIQPAFIRQVQLLRAGGQRGPVHLHAHQRPGPGTDVGPVGFAGVGGGHAGDGGGRVVGGRGHHVDLAQAGPVRDPGAQRAELRAGWNDLRENVRRQAELLQQAGRPNCA